MKRLLTIITAIVIAITSFADNRIYIEDTTLPLGSDITLPIFMENGNSVTAFQFDLTLPEGITLKESLSLNNTPEKDGITLNADRTPGSTHSLSYSKTADGVYHVICYSINLNAFNGNEGVIANIRINAPSNAGSYQISLSNIEMTEMNMNMISCNPCTANLTLTHIAEGTVGTCHWYITIDDGMLVIEPANGVSGDLPAEGWTNTTSNSVHITTVPWGEYRDKILSAKIMPGVNATSCSNMFCGLSNMAGIDLGNFNTANVTNMSFMFSGCSALTSLDLSNFNTANVADMSYMFFGCSALTSLDLSSFNTTNVTDMSGMFDGCPALTSLDLSSFNTANVTDMSGMFFWCPALTSLDLSNFNTANVTDMSNMFNDCSGLTSLDLSSFNTANVTDMSGMFNDCFGLTSLDLSNFNTAKVTSMFSMFGHCYSLTSLDLSSFNTANVTDMSGMFFWCPTLTSLNLSNFNTEKVTDMSSMFEHCIALTSLNLSNFNTANVTKMNNMFDNCSSLTTLDLSNFNTANVTNMSGMFSGCSKLSTIISNNTTPSPLKAGTFSGSFEKRAYCTLFVPSEAKTLYAAADGWNELGIIMQDITIIANGKVGTCTWYITKDEGMLVIEPANGISGDLPEWNIEHGDSVIATKSMWMRHRENILSAKIMSGVNAHVSCSYLFCTLNNIKKIDISGLNTTNVTDMSGMFSGCSSLTSLDLSNFNTANVRYMSGMFYGCSALRGLNLTNFNTVNVTDMSRMFEGCTNLTEIVSENTTPSPLKVGTFSESFENRANCTLFVPKGTKALYAKENGWNELGKIDDGVYEYDIKYYVDGVLYQTQPVTEGTKIPVIESPTKTGHTFMKWNGLPEDLIMPAHDIEVNAVFSVNSYTLTFNSNGGSEVAPITAAYGSVITKPADPVREGHTFIGWDPEIPETMPAENMTFTAQWQINSYKLTYKVDGEIYKEYDIEYNAVITPEAAPEKKGYTFSGWSEIPATMPANDVEVTGTFTKTIETIAEGTEGTCDWYITKDGGMLVIEPSDGDSGVLPTGGWSWISEQGSIYTTAAWGKYHESILSAKVMPGVNAKSCKYMFHGLSKMETIDISNLNTVNVSSMLSMFDGCLSLTSLDLSNFNTANVTDMMNMFNGCKSLSSINISGINTAKVTSMRNMFYDCSSLTSIDLSSFNTERVTDMSWMFHGCASLTSLDIKYLNTAIVNNMRGMFSGCSSLTSLDLSSFNTTSVENMNGMFNRCSALTSLALSSFNTEKVTDMSSMFAECTAITSLDLSNLNTANVTKMSNLFDGCSSLTSLDLSNFNTTNASVYSMFTGCHQLTTIITNNTTPSPLKIGTFTESFTYRSKCTLVVPFGTKALYAAADGWKELGKIWYGYDDVFDLENISYEVTSENQKTVNVTGIVDKTVNEIIVPAEVQNSGITYNVATIADNAFADCTNLLEVTFEGAISIPADIFAADASERNLFVYAPAGSTSEYKGNVVIGGVAENVILHDAKPLRLSKEFTANKVSYSREFHKQTYPNEAGGWETIVLPFDVKQIVSEKRDVLTPFRSGVEDSKHFWLAGLTSNGFGRASTISANIPYIICMPNSPEYYDDYNITGVVTFSAENAAMHRTMDAATYTGNAFKLVPAYEGADASVDVYAINDSEILGHHAGALFVSNSRTVRPFEAYAAGISGGAKPIFFTIGSDDATGITDINVSADTHNMMYDLSGRRTDGQHKGIVIMRNANGKYSKKYNK